MVKARKHAGERETTQASVFKVENGNFRLGRLLACCAAGNQLVVKKWESGSGLITLFNMYTKPQPLCHFFGGNRFSGCEPTVLTKAYLGE